MYVGVALFWALGLFTHPGLALWPAPASIEFGSEVYWLSNLFQLKLYCGEDQKLFSSTNGFQAGASASHSADEQLLLSDIFIDNHSSQVSHHSEEYIIQAAIQRNLYSIKNTAFVPWKFYPRQTRFEPDTTQNLQLITSIDVRQAECPTGSHLDPQTFFGGDESYEILITNQTSRIISNSSIGTIRALQTLEQLFYAHSLGGVYIPRTPIHICDRPRWSHRGLSLDIARNEFSPRDVMRTLDGMATAKMSRLHLHATDSQSWPIEIPALEELARKGAYQSNLVWSAKDLKQVQVYGLQRGISVFIEIDMPGHTASIAYAYPDLIAAFNQRDWSTFAAEPLSGQLKLNSSKVYEFLETLFGDLLPRLSPFSTLYHSGGDELNQMVHLLDETVRSSEVKVIQPFLQTFVDFVVSKIHAAGLQLILWEEMLLDWNLTLPSARDSSPGKGVIIQVWRDSQHILQVLERGHHVLFGDYGHWYLDCGYGGFIDPFAGGKSPPGVPFNTSGGQRTRIKDPFLDYCGPYKNWRHIYMYDPLRGIPAGVQHLVQGGEVLLWSEQTDSVNLDSKLWPRAAAAAEVLWAGSRETDMIGDASMRLGEWRERVVLNYGVQSGPVQMTWCLMEGGCDM